MNTYRSLDAIQQDIHSGKTTCLSLTQSYLDRISEHKNLNAFLEVYEEEALENAQRIDQKVKDGKAGKLAGMVIGIKDNICYKDHKVSC